jgi:hypothetical protein
VNEDQIEQEIQAKGLTAPRVTKDDIGAEIVSEYYFSPAKAVSPDIPLPASNPLSRLIFCVLVLRNGFTVTGESACASPENFNAEIGRKIAREKAIEKVWPLLGFRLRDELSRPRLTDADAQADLDGQPRPDWPSEGRP